MTDTNRIDLDEIAESDDDEPDANRGDWFWQGEGDPDAEPGAPEYTPAETGVSRAEASAAEDADERSSAAEAEDDSATGTGDDSTTGNDGEVDETAEVTSDPIPKVPRKHGDRPVGMPAESGGAGAGRAADIPDAPDAPAGRSTASSPDAEEMAEQAPEGSGDLRSMGGGPHGGEADDMTMALTYNAVTQLEDPAFVITSARAWADWIGIVGEVEAPVINSFQREHQIDADFFNGTGTGPAERLANVTETSMFYAKRMAVVGTEADEWIAEEADWEFVPFEDAAEKSGWTVVEE